MKKLLILFGVLFFLTFVFADLTGDINPIEINKTKPNIIYSISTPLSENKITQLQADPYINCPVENNQIVCYPMTPEQKGNLTASLGLISKTEFNLLGIPVNKGGFLGGIFPSFISPDVKTIIPVDLTTTGTITIGFHTNIYDITSITNGITNNTQILSGILYLSGNNLTGEWYSGIADLNTTKTISNISYVSTEPSGSDIYNYVRTHNLTNGNLADGLTYYLKMDDGSLKDYSGFNRTFTYNSSVDSFTANGKFNGAYVSSGKSTGGINAINSLEINAQNNFTVSIWFKRNALSVSVAQYLMDFRNSGNSANYSFFIRTSTSTNLLNYYIYNESGSATSMNLGTINDYNWHNVVVGYNGTAYGYLDGVYKGKITLFGLPRNSSNVIKIGKDFLSTSQFNGTIDEVMIYNRSLSGAEIIALNSTEKYPWSSYSSGCNTGACSVSVSDGRYVQVKSVLSRSGSENVYENSISLGYTDIGGVPPAIDNPPTSTLTTTDGQTFNINNATLTGIQTDDIMLKNASIWTNTTGTWAFNQTLMINGTSNSTSFVVRNIPQGTYKYNIQVCDNSSQCVWASANRTFTIALTCNDADCYPYTCKPDNTCYTSCTAHNQCNSSSYCSTVGSCLPSIQPTSECANKVWTGLTSDEVCINQATGWCYNNIGSSNKYCTATQTNCVDNGNQYTQGTFACTGSGPYTTYQCLGGTNAWSSSQSCKSLGTPFSQTATYHSGGYCGYYYQEGCGTGGCTPAIPATQDCGNYVLVGSSCGTGASSCDIGCGATYDLSTCPSGLSSDCNTCSPPSGEDNPPIVTLFTPADSSTQTTTNIAFGYKVLEDWKINNCSLYFKTNSIAWHLNQTNSSAVTRDGITINYFNQNFNNGDSITWNVNCYDNSSQLGYGDSNFTFTINTAFQEIFKPLRVFNGSENTAELFSIDENGNVFIKGNLNLNTSDSNINLSELGVILIDLTSLTTTGIKFTNPYNNYLKLAGKTGGSLLINLVGNNPELTTDTGDFISIGKAINISGNTAVIGSLRVTGSIYGTSLAFSSINVTTINQGGGPVYIGGEYEVGGVTIQNGEIFAQNLTLPSGSYLQSSGIINNGSIFPSVNNTYDIGNTSLIWRRGFFRGLNITGDDVYINGIPMSTINLSMYNYVNAQDTGMIRNDTIANLTRLGIGNNVASNYLLTIGTSATAMNVSGLLYVNSTSIGINTKTAYTLVDAQGNIRSTRVGYDNLQYIQMYSDSNGNFLSGVSQANNDKVFYIDQKSSSTPANVANNIQFRTGTGPTTKMILTSNGSLGIGLSSTVLDSLLTIAQNASALNVSGNLYVNTTNVGIGVIKPAYSLEISNNANALNVSGNLYVNTTNVGIGVIKPAYSLEISNNAKALNVSGNLYVNTTNVGIGTSTPTHTLNVVGSANITSDLWLNGVNISTLNLSMFTYVLAVNTTAGNYAVYVNSTMRTYVLAVNTTAGAYADYLNTTMRGYVLSTNLSMYNYVNANLGIKNDTIANLTRLGIGNNVATNYLLTIGTSATALNVSGNLYVNTTNIWTIGNVNLSGMLYVNTTNVGIGVIKPAYSLEISNNAKALNVSGNLYANTTNIWTIGNVNLSGMLYVNTTNVGIGTSNPTNPFQVAGPSYSYTYDENSDQTGLSPDDGTTDVFASGGAATYDGNWDTSDSDAVYNLPIEPAILYVNYTKPANSIEGTLWQVKDGLDTVNLTIPTICWANDLDSTKLILRAQSQDRSACLSGDTLVKTLEGEKRIDSLNKGDLVYSYNNGKIEQDKVINVQSDSISKAGNKWYNIYTSEGKIKATYDHEFYVVGKGYIKAEELKVGDILLDYNLKNITIQKIKIENNYNDKIWEIGVEKNHNFFANDILVHNVADQVLWDCYSTGWANLKSSGTKLIYEEAIEWYTQTPGTGGGFVISSAGNVGIGTASPTHTLNVVGTMNVTSSLTSSGNINSASFSVNGTNGYTGTVTIRNSAGTGTCNLVYKGGILTSTTC